MESNRDEIAPGQILRDRYIPIESVPEVLGVTVKRVQKLIDNKAIRYAEFMKPGAHKRTVHVDPVEVCKALKIKCDERGMPL